MASKNFKATSKFCCLRLWGCARQRPRREAKPRWRLGQKPKSNNNLGITLPETNSLPFAPEHRLKRPKRKRKSIPTIHFQVLLLLVSGRVSTEPRILKVNKNIYVYIHRVLYGIFTYIRLTLMVNVGRYTVVPWILWEYIMNKKWCEKPSSWESVNSTKYM